MRPTRALVCFFLLGASVCHAASVCVNPGGTGGCLASIQQAVNTVAPRGRVDVAAGTYGESLSIPFGAQIQIYGAGAALTVIDGTDGSPVVLMGSTEDAGSSLAISDLTLTGGSDGVHAYNGWLKRVRTAISRCIISGNTGAGVTTQGRLEMTDSSVRDNGGYGIYSSSGRAEIERSTISGNLGDGIHCFASTCLILASTVSGNSGAGLASVPIRVLVRATTIARNGVGLDIHDGYSAYVQSSIVADSAPGPDVAAGSPPLHYLSRGYNIFETEDPSASIHYAVTDLSADPVLGPLQDNGGPTETHELLPGSPALETSMAGCGRADQRGISRGFPPCDKGAFEAP